MTGTTVITLVLCLAMLTLRYVTSRRVAGNSSKHGWQTTARVLISAALSLAAIHYTLQRQASELDGQPHEASLMERIVRMVTN